MTTLLRVVADQLQESAKPLVHKRVAPGRIGGASGRAHSEASRSDGEPRRFLGRLCGVETAQGFWIAVTYRLLGF